MCIYIYIYTYIHSYILCISLSAYLHCRPGGAGLLPRAAAEVPRQVPPAGATYTSE